MAANIMLWADLGRQPNANQARRVPASGLICLRVVQALDQNGAFTLTMTVRGPPW